MELLGQEGQQIGSRLLPRQAIIPAGARQHEVTSGIKKHNKAAKSCQVHASPFQCAFHHAIDACWCACVALMTYEAPPPPKLLSNTEGLFFYAEAAQPSIACSHILCSSYLA